ncbi:MAG TPA: aspartyl/asparaginyl beta-hydroxylase domain-containing protein [Dokdonella sp.]
MQANPRKTTSIRNLGTIELGSVRDDILAIPPEVWEQENAGKPNRYGVLDQTQHIIFRFISSPDDWRAFYDRPPWAAWAGRLEPLLQQATAAYGYRRGAFPRILLARMPPGGVIHAHVDSNPAAQWPHKIHVPILTNPDVSFFIGPQRFHLEVGQAYEVNNLVTHAVQNLGATYRIHLIFEYYDEDQEVVAA